MHTMIQLNHLAPEGEERGGCRHFLFWEEGRKRRGGKKAERICVVVFLFLGKEEKGRSIDLPFSKEGPGEVAQKEEGRGRGEGTAAVLSVC